MMFESLFGVLFEIVGEAALQLLCELISDAGISSTGVKQLSERVSPFIAMLGLALLGGLWGVFTALVLPHRLFLHPPVPGLSLVVSPIVSGTAMYRYGRWRSQRRMEISALATFWGGAVFAAALAATRFTLISTAIRWR